MKKLIFLILLLFDLVFYSCNKNLFWEKVWRITIKNLSSNEIYCIDPYYDKKSKKISGTNLFPDTALPFVKPQFVSVNISNENYIDFTKDYETVFKAIPSGKLSIYILCKDTVDLLSWDKVREGYKILKRYDYTYEELKNMDWTIVYP